MNNNQTLEKMRQMRLRAMAQLHQQQVQDNQSSKFTPDEYLSILIDYEYENRENNKIQRFIKQAHFREQAHLSDINYEVSRNLDKNQFARLSTLDFIQRKENIILTGAAGVGKSYLAQALGHQACMHGQKVLYSNTARFLAELKLSKLDGTYLKELKKMEKIHLLILDDFGLQSFDKSSAEILLDIVDDRFNKTSSIISSQIPVPLWYDLIGEGTIADAILDRIVNSSHRIELKGESLRKKHLPK